MKFKICFRRIQILIRKKRKKRLVFLMRRLVFSNEFVWKTGNDDAKENLTTGNHEIDELKWVRAG